MEREVAKWLLMAAAVVLLFNAVVKAIDPPNHIAKSWMQVLMFDPTPMGATIFDKDWSKCPTK